jgi:hypothetical protein
MQSLETATPMHVLIHLHGLAGARGVNAVRLVMEGLGKDVVIVSMDQTALDLLHK